MTDNRCYAAIDIGTNAVRLLIKKVKDDGNSDIHVPVIGLADGIIDSLYLKSLEQ